MRKRHGSQEEWADGKPFIIAARGLVPELFLLMRKDAAERHKEWTDAALQNVSYFGVRRNVDPAKKVAATIAAIEADAKAFLTNISIDRGAEAAATSPHYYSDLEKSVAGWSLKEWETFRGNVQIKLKNKQPISQFELDCSSVWSQLGTWVSHRAEVSDDVYFIGSERLERLCPGSFEEHVTDYGKNLRTYRWSNRLGDVVESTLQAWVDEDDHEKCSLLLLGDAEIGKSKLAMLVAQEPSGTSAIARGGTGGPQMGIRAATGRGRPAAYGTPEAARRGRRVADGIGAHGGKRSRSLRAHEEP